MRAKIMCLLLIIVLLCTSRAASSRVAVAVTRRLAVPPVQARQAWLDYAWAAGGGLPLVASLVSADGLERTLLPLMLRECLVEDGYVLKDAGALAVDVPARSHRAKLLFEQAVDALGSTDLTWHVEFETTSRSALWAAVTETTVGEVCANLEAYTATPSFFVLEAQLAASPSACLACWLECFRDGDLGLPLPMLPPIVLNEGADSGSGYERLILPPGLRERLLEVDDGGGAATTTSLSYSVMNPSWLTCYPAHSHRGDVTFRSVDAEHKASALRWVIAVRPMRGGAALVRALTELIVPAFTTNLAARVAEGSGADDVASVTFGWSKSGPGVSNCALEVQL